MKSLLFIATILFFVNSSIGQLVDPSKINYTKELTFGINTNTNSSLIGGFNIRYSKEVTGPNWKAFSLEIVNVKHHKEIRSTGLSGNSFIVGKNNYLFAIRPEMAWERVLFSKDKQDGIRLQSTLAFGPSIGLLKPYYVEVQKTEVRKTEDYWGNITYDTVTFTVSEPYSIEKHSPTQIVGSGGFFNGFDQLKAVLGFHIKGGLQFEFGLYDTKVSMIEVGYLFEAYLKDIQVHEVQQNQQLWSSVYLNFSIGNKYPDKKSKALLER